MHTAMSRQRGLGRLFIALLACVLCLAPDVGQASRPEAVKAAKIAAAARRTGSPHRADSLPNSANAYYRSLWGADHFLVRSTASGSLIRFSFRVVDPVRAEALNDDRAAPRLVDLKRGIELQVPTLEKVGELRQKSKPVAGMEYWMVFSNKGHPVKVGDHVNVVIGPFHADGLVVE